MIMFLFFLHSTHVGTLIVSRLRHPRICCDNWSRSLSRMNFWYDNNVWTFWRTCTKNITICLSISTHCQLCVLSVDLHDWLQIIGCRLKINRYHIKSLLFSKLFILITYILNTVLHLTVYNYSNFINVQI